MVREILNRVFKSKNYTHETPVLAIILRVPVTSVSPYINPHISAESWRMKTTRRPYFIFTSQRFIFRSRKYFFAFIFTSNCHDDVMITSPQQASSWSRRLIFNFFETGKLHLKKLVSINHHLVVFIQHDPGEIRGLYRVDSFQTRSAAWVPTLGY